ncbi:MAG TPA: STELLO glycosyltransferase family protein [Armatimonadota bacterium]|jgi:hypothetical protein
MRWIVITSINYPTESVRRIGGLGNGWQPVLVADRKTPADWAQEGFRFLSVEEQARLGLTLGNRLPFNTYSRKNLGYLLALREGAEVIAETDDDNRPYEHFLRDVSPTVMGQRVTSPGWVNIYRLFTEKRVWPRGLPLEAVNASFHSLPATEAFGEHDCPIQQYLADGDPDVDAVYRLTQEQEVLFGQGSYVLAPGCFCPFNSQNTIWYPPAFPLMYLPSHVSFRMTDIWRSFVAQVCLRAQGSSLAFHGPTVYQERNEHSLLRDFQDEVPGYLNNTRLMELLSGLSLGSGDTKADLRLCYTALVDAGIVPAEELNLVDAWLTDLQQLGL